MLRAAVVATTIVLQGCASMYVYPEVDDAARVETAGRLSRFVLGVQRNPGNFDYGWAREPRSPYDLQTLIDALNEHRVFKRVAYLDQLQSEPDLILTGYRHAKPDFRGLHGEAGGLLCVGYYYPISLLTLTALPIYCSSEEEASFVISDRTGATQRSLKFERYDKMLIGVWAPVVSAINPNWHSTSTRDESDKRKHAQAELTKRYKAFVAKKFRELEPSILGVFGGE